MVEFSCIALEQCELNENNENEQNQHQAVRQWYKSETYFQHFDLPTMHILGIRNHGAVKKQKQIHFTCELAQ